MAIWSVYANTTQYLWLDDSEEIVEELFLSNLYVESQPTVLDTGLQHLQTIGEGSLSPAISHTLDCTLEACLVTWVMTDIMEPYCIDAHTHARTHAHNTTHTHTHTHTHTGPSTGSGQDMIIQDHAMPVVMVVSYSQCEVDDVEVL